MKQQFIDSQLTKEFLVLWEAPKKEPKTGKMLNFAYTPNYLRVACQHQPSQNLENTMRLVTLKTSTDSYIEVSHCRDK
jgi:threonylcarbamoyladenosine tRNA methylthiotransferase MtaB